MVVEADDARRLVHGDDRAVVGLWLGGRPAPASPSRPPRAGILGTHVGIDLLGSNRGLAGCRRIEFFRGGFGYSWDSGKLTVMGPLACDVGPWRTTPSAGASQTGARALELPQGVSVPRLTGREAVPDVTLTGPAGQTVSTALPRRDDRFVVLRDPSTKAAYVAIHHGRGHWRASGTRRRSSPRACSRPRA